MKTALRGPYTPALIALVLGAAAFARAQQVPPPPSVLLVSLDTMRADRIGAYGYKLAATPNLDRLAREGVLFADATTQSPLTGPAHVALLTGQYPTRLGIKSNASTALSDSASTLAEILRGAGYQTGAFIGAFVLDRSYGFGQGFEVFDSIFREFRPETAPQVQRTADEVARPALAWLNTVAGTSPFFAWIHLYDAHAPYGAPSPFGAKFRAHPYDGEIAYVDMVIGRLLAALSKSGALDRTIVVAVGDHGEALGEHGEDEHGIFLYESVLRIPWIVRLPKAERAGSVVSEQVRAIDLTPTLLDLAGIPANVRFDGESIARVMRGEARRDPPASYADAYYPQLHFGWSLLRSLRVGEWKFIDAPKAELYDMRVDRAERRNLLSERANVGARMAAELKTTERSFGTAAAAAPPQPDPETLARLRSLGYIGIAAPSSGATRGPDPKDKIQEFKVFRALLREASADMAAGQSDAAIENLKRAVAINPRAYDLHVLLGDAWRLKGDHDRALGEYAAAAVLNPDIAAPHILAADVYRLQGMLEKALERLETAARLEPGSGAVAFGKGRVYERGGRANEALAEYERAIAMNPSDAVARSRFANVAMNIRRFDLAEPHLRILLDLNYQPARTHHALGYVAEVRGDHAAAVSEYRRALALDPNLQPAREALARITQK